MRRLLSALAGLLRGLWQATIEQSTEMLELEEAELRHAMLTLLYGSLVGVPLAPIGLSAALAPLLAEEARSLADRTWRGADVISDLFSRMGGEW